MEEDPGYREFRLCPVIGGSLNHAEATMDTPCGTIRSAWEKTGDRMSYRFEIPANTHALIELPVDGINVEAVTAGVNAQREGDRVVFRLGSGRYDF